MIKVFFKKGTLVCFLLLACSYSMTLLLDGDVYRVLLNAIGWIVNLPVYIIGTILVVRAFSKYLKNEINGKDFFYSVPMLMVSLAGVISLAYALIKVVKEL
ncbi:MAG: hypothetical protein HRT71_17145 [Flavobacteriales bacterium]|nr:hypothetical protein [Flavobacteriales bacterium]